MWHFPARFRLLLNVNTPPPISPILELPRFLRLGGLLLLLRRFFPSVCISRYIGISVSSVIFFIYLVTLIGIGIKPPPLAARERLGQQPGKGKISREGQTFPGNFPFPGNIPGISPGTLPGRFPGRLLSDGGYPVCFPGNWRLAAGG